jgi:hypothetical protein
VLELELAARPSRVAEQGGEPVALLGGELGGPVNDL